MLCTERRGTRRILCLPPNMERVFNLRRSERFLCGYLTTGIHWITMQARMVLTLPIFNGWCVQFTVSVLCSVCGRAQPYTRRGALYTTHARPWDFTPVRPPPTPVRLGRRGWACTIGYIRLYITCFSFPSHVYPKVSDPKGLEYMSIGDFPPLRACNTHRFLPVFV